MSVQAFMGAFALAASAMVLAAVLFWRRHPPIFWFACALTIVGVGYLTATGATEDIARLVWPAAFDSAKRRELETSTVTNFDKTLGALLIVLPFLSVIAWISWRHGAVPPLPSVLLTVLFIALHMTPYSARLARLVFPKSVLEAPMWQMQSREAIRK